MCLIAFSYQQHPSYDFIFIANRDEFYGRPTRPAQFWEDHHSLLAGKDLKEGGTWMGITERGRFSALTNYRNPSTRKEDAPSRGHLVLDYLKGGNPPELYLRRLHPKADKYNGFNLLVGAPGNLMYYSNKSNQATALDAGLYGLSNDVLDTSWPKTKQAKQQLSAVIQQDEDSIDKDALFEILQNEKQAADDQLPDTGIPKELERAVSPIFIKTEKYGTRSSTIVLISKEGEVTFEERRYKKEAPRLRTVTGMSSGLKSKYTLHP
ncbi:MAG: NRDE family protein [Balneolaceae bacterium]|nr:NRDE family protein [Balneolaceae bacterium]